MVKKFEVGDKVICLKTAYYGNSVIFAAGEYYTISNVGHIYYIIDGVSFQINLKSENSFDTYFGTLQQYRKQKLEKLKSYGKHQDIQSML